MRPRGVEHWGGRYCPVCGYDQAPFRGARLRRCPECGTALESGQLLSAPPRGPFGRGTRLLAVVAGSWYGRAAMLLVVGAVLIAATVRYFDRDTATYSAESWVSLQLRDLHQSSVLFAGEHGGRYPVHVARLIKENYQQRPDVFLDPRGVGPGTVSVGGYDLAAFDGSSEAEGRLAEALADCDVSNPWYRIGDFWFVRLPAPTGDRSIIAGWSLPDDRGNRYVLFDDNHTERLNESGWHVAWRFDAAARQRRAMEPLAPPG